MDCNGGRDVAKHFNEMYTQNTCVHTPHRDKHERRRLAHRSFLKYVHVHAHHSHMPLHCVTPCFSLPSPSLAQARSADTAGALLARHQVTTLGASMSSKSSCSWHPSQRCHSGEEDSGNVGRVASQRLPSLHCCLCKVTTQRLIMTIPVQVWRAMFGCHSVQEMVKLMVLGLVAPQPFFL